METTHWHTDKQGIQAPPRLPIPTCVGMTLPVSYATSTEAASTESSAHTSHPMARRSLKRWSQPVCSREERKLEELWGGGGGGEGRGQEIGSREEWDREGGKGRGGVREGRGKEEGGEGKAGKEGGREGRGQKRGKEGGQKREKGGGQERGKKGERRYRVGRRHEVGRGVAEKQVAGEG